MVVGAGAVTACSSSDEATLEVGEGLLVKDAECLRFDAPDGKGSACGDAVHDEPWARVVGAWAYGVAPADTSVVRAPGAEQAEFLDVDGKMAFAVRYDTAGPLTAESDDGAVLLEFNLDGGR